MLGDRPERRCTAAVVVAAVAEARLLADGREPTAEAVAALAKDWGFVDAEPGPDAAAAAQPILADDIGAALAMLTEGLIGPRFTCAKCGKVVASVFDDERGVHLNPNENAVLVRLRPGTAVVERKDFCSERCARSWRAKQKA